MLAFESKDRFRRGIAQFTMLRKCQLIQRRAGSFSVIGILAACSLPFLSHAQAILSDQSGSGLPKEPTPLVAEIVVAGDEYLDALSSAQKFMNERYTDAVIMRSQIVRLDQNALSRLLEASENGPTELEENFDITIFADSPCTISEITKIRRSEDQSNWSAQARCDNTDADVFVSSGSGHLILQYLGRRDLRVSRINDDNLFVALEPGFPAAGQHDF